MDLVIILFQGYNRYNKVFCELIDGYEISFLRFDKAPFKQQKIELCAKWGFALRRNYPASG